MNGIDEFCEVAGAIFAAVIALMAWLTYLEQSLYVEQRPRSGRVARSGPVAVVAAWAKARRRG